MRRCPRRIFNDFNNRSDDKCENVSDRETASCTSSDEEEDDDDSEEEDYKIYRLTDKNDWRKVGSRTRARNVTPIPFTGDKEEFTVKISDEELEDLRDDSGDIRFYKVFQWLLPKYDDQSLWEFLAARMRNYMIHLMLSFTGGTAKIVSRVHHVPSIDGKPRSIRPMWHPKKRAT